MIATIIVSAIVLVLLDSIYLYLFAPLFISAIQNLQTTTFNVNVGSALLCYIVLICGINFFILFPHKSPFEAFLLGILIYAVYETTNYAIFTKWPLYMVIIDTLWGGILFSITTYLTYLIT